MRNGGTIPEYQSKREFRDALRENPESIRYYPIETWYPETTWFGPFSDIQHEVTVIGPNPNYRGKRWQATVKRSKNGKLVVT